MNNAINFRTVAEITAAIEATNNVPEGQSVDGGLLTILTLELRVAEAIVKYEAALSKRANAARYEAIDVGAKVKLNFGRGEKARVVEGVVTFAALDDKGNKQIVVLSGEGLDQTTVRVPVTAVIFDEPQQGELAVEGGQQ